MKRFFLGVLIFLAAAGLVSPSFAQVTYATVTATITDPTGNPFANAAYSISLVNSLGNPVSSATTPNGSLFNAKPVYGNLDANGFMSVQLAENSILSKPSGTQWAIVVSYPQDAAILLYQPPWTINYTVSVTANVDLSTPISALSQTINFMNLKTGQSTLISTQGCAGGNTIAHGCTGGTSQSTARSSLGTAASGANSDITSLAGLTTPLSAGQGGTGNTTGTAQHALNLPADFATQSALSPNVVNGTNGTFSGTVAAPTIANVSSVDTTGATDNSSVINTAVTSFLASGKGALGCIALPTGMVYAPSLLNPQGVPFCGDGVLLKSIIQQQNYPAYPDAYKAQLNTYATVAPRINFGWEYMSHWINGALGNLYQYNSQIYVGFLGDSRFAGQNLSLSNTIEQLFLTAASNHKIPLGITPGNYAISGSTTHDPANPTTADLLNTQIPHVLADGNVDSVVINSGYNDPAHGISTAQTISNIRTALACLRNGVSYNAGLGTVTCTPHTVDQTSIILVTPISGNDNESLRAPLALETFRNGYAQAAHDYQSGFIDFYALMPDNDFNQGTSSLMMDVPYGVGTDNPVIYIHPGNSKNPTYAKALEDFMFAPIDSITGGTGCANVSNLSANLLFSSAPNIYPHGCSIYRTLATNGWPYDGMVTTTKSIDDTIVTQTVTQTGAATSTACFRVAASATTWNALACPLTSAGVGGRVLQSGSNPYFVQLDTTAQTPTYYTNGGDATTLSQNRDPQTGLFVNTLKSAWTQTCKVFVTGTSSYCGWFTSATANLLPLEHARIGQGLMVGTASVAGADPGNGFVNADNGYEINHNIVGVVASGSIAMPVTTVATVGCGATVTSANATVRVGDVIAWSYIGSPGAAALLNVLQWPTAGNVNFTYCNPTAASITTAALTLNWTVSR